MFFTNSSSLRNRTWHSFTCYSKLTGLLNSHVCSANVLGWVHNYPHMTGAEIIDNMDSINKYDWFTLGLEIFTLSGVDSQHFPAFVAAVLQKPTANSPSSAWEIPLLNVEHQHVERLLLCQLAGESRERKESIILQKNLSFGCACFSDCFNLSLGLL